MKKSKIMIPVMTLGLAVGLAFANTANQSNGWIDLDGTPTQLSNDPCTGTSQNCSVRFEEDPQQRNFEVYTDMSLTTRKASGVDTPYLIPGTP
ncbi:DUF6520 family protein [Leeuwenhoekiella parthenopeia]|uniref:DUF6520 family protein n=1 Tax=Leeuwenhoekiella parthenopeia TaxID=2890320 RepID=A0ABS8GMT4_9FLAO|nr:DUF6520 family protein [Leeuwenhoekiella parthenopeia]MCC4211292.1 DUF6520 family protein [Leeuwenhoekiella parthenopeia]